MTEHGNIEQAAQYLAQRYAARASLDIMQQAYAPTSIAEAYRVQDAFLQLLGQTKGALGGYKIAYTSDEMRRLRGISSPCAGGMFASTMQPAPATLRGADYVALAIECEVAVRLGADVPAARAPYTRASLEEYIASLAVAFELVDFRGAAAGSGPDATAITGICTNIANAGAVFGPAVRDWRGLDLAAARGVMCINGVQVGEGRGADVMGHPLEPLAWLANLLAERGRTLQAGMTVITGSIIPPKPLKAGDTATIAIDGLGEAQVTVC
ncbi:MAG: 2-keto-4-pentenoate hydratase [Candidatus Tectimicrobiota bacterium]